ncbi:MAG: shikimate dehydrogenase, partial [Candidatus Latescibacteria bacterium]|nr:shikimate dehydrogenase [Candidatus Latescibacterota bacterium]
LRRALLDAGLLINTTSVGMSPKVDASPIGDWDVLHPGLTVYDAVFNPLETRLMRQAKAAGARAFGGIEMLVYQGARSLEIWSGRPAPVGVMKEAILEGIGDW